MARKKVVQQTEIEDFGVAMEEAPIVANINEAYDEEDVAYAEREIFPGGPTGNDIEKWKSQYNGEVYMTEFDDEDIFVWRPIRRKEYKDIAKVPNADQFYKEERVCEKAILFPKGYGFMNMAQGKAGIPSLMYELILEKSGFVAKTGAMRLS